MQRKVSALENRLTLLYALDALGETSNIQLLTFFTELNLMDYIALELSLHDLVTAGYLQSSLDPIGTLYVKTEAGGEALRMFLKRLPVSKQKTIDVNKSAYRRRFMEERAVIGDYRVLENGKTQLELKIAQDGGWLMLILMILPEGADVHGLISAFHVRAREVYGHLFQALSAGYVPAGEVGETTLTELTSGHFNDDEFSITLALPKGDLAAHFKAVFERENKRLKAELLRLLSV